MKYLKGLFINFLIVFFANHVLPGIEVMDPTKLPHLGGDLLFPLALGLLNSLIYPALKLLHRPATITRVALIAFILNFAAYASLKLLPVGIRVSSVEGYLLAAICVSLGSLLFNYIEVKRGGHHTPKESSHEEPMV